jgi:hypothetical protein
MSDLYIQAGSPTEWVRPGGWVDIPSITSADTRFYGVYAVYETKKNSATLSFQTTPFNVTINWGDGTPNDTASTNIIITHTYQYSALTSPILVDEYGQNYKTALVTITQNSGSLGRLIIGTTTEIGTSNWLDIVMSWSTAVVSLGKSLPILQRFIQYTGTWQGNNVNQYMVAIPSCRVLQIPLNFGTPTQAVSVFQYLGDCEVGDISVGGAISINSMFTSSRIRKIGNINFSAATTTLNIFSSALNLREVGNINLASTPNMTSLFNACINLLKIGTITSTSVTNINTMFQNCYSLREITFTSCALITTLSNTFINCHSLENIRVPGLVVSVSFIDCAMERAAIVQVFNDLGTPGTTRTITITRNPGSADLTAADLLIATSKNWTVTL